MDDMNQDVTDFQQGEKKKTVADIAELMQISRTKAFYMQKLGRNLLPEFDELFDKKLLTQTLALKIARKCNKDVQQVLLNEIGDISNQTKAEVKTKIESFLKDWDDLIVYKRKGIQPSFWNASQLFKKAEEEIEQACKLMQDAPCGYGVKPSDLVFIYGDIISLDKSVAKALNVVADYKKLLIDSPAEECNVAPSAPEEGDLTET